MNPEYSPSAFRRSSIKNYESGVEDALRYTRRFCTFIGIWPRITSNPTTIERIVSKLTLPFSMSTILIHVIILLLHFLSKNTSDSEQLMIIAPLIFESTCFLKHVTLFLRTRLIKNCVEHMRKDWRKIDNENDQRIMTKNLKVGHAVTFVFSVSMYSSGIFYHGIMPICERFSSGVNDTAPPRAYAGFDIFLDPYAGYNYEIIYCIVCLASFFIHTVVVSVCNLAAISVTHACGQIEVIMFKLENLLSTDEQQDVNKDVVANRIGIIIRYHVRVLKFAAQIDQALCEICFLEVTSATVIICLVEYDCMKEWESSDSDSVAIVTYILLVISSSSQVYIFCYVGELLKSQFLRVGFAAYNVPWYELPGRTGLALVMIIVVANYPPQLTAGKMIELSIYMFGTIMRTSIGYLNMLRNMA